MIRFIQSFELTNYLSKIVWGVSYISGTDKCFGGLGHTSGGVLYSYSALSVGDVIVFCSVVLSHYLFLHITLVPPPLYMSLYIVLVLQ